MKNFLFINCKGYNIEQAITALDEQLKIIKEDPAMSAMEIQSCSFTNGMEMPYESNRLAITSPRQPVMIINCTVLLIEKFNAEALINELMPVARSMMKKDMTEEPTEQQKKDLLFAKGFFGKNITEVCKHHNLDPETHMRKVNGEYSLYRTCVDCGFHVYQDPGNENLPE